MAAQKSDSQLASSNILPVLMLRRFFLSSPPSPFQLLARLPLLPSTLTRPSPPLLQTQFQAAAVRRLTTAALQSSAPQDQLISEIQKDSAAENITAPLVDWQAHPLPSHPLRGFGAGPSPAPTPQWRLITPPPPPPLSIIAGQRCRQRKLAALCMGRGAAYGCSSQVGINNTDTRF
jgi:hypothetical protein